MFTWSALRTLDPGVVIDKLARRASNSNELNFKAPSAGAADSACNDSSQLKSFSPPATSHVAVRAIAADLDATIIRGHLPNSKFCFLATKSEEFVNSAALCNFGLSGANELLAVRQPAS